MISGSPTSQLVRVNASAGDAYLFADVPVANIRGITFDLNDDFYLVNSAGRLYKYNLSSGDTTPVGNTGVSNLYGLTINPLNGQMWGVTLTGTLYKINKSDASATSVGPVSAGIIADICFDKVGKLYGLSGLGTQNSSLISIDTTNGAGSTIGATGLQGINGLAISPEVVGIEPISSVIPDKYELYQNYPNPFNPNTNIKFDLPKGSNVKLTIYNSLGQKVAELFNGELSAGTYRYSWGAGNFASGIYFYRLETDEFVQTKKLVLLK
ncbi:MAG: T9SS type A sorting domain-containing protein [Ignavibacteriae bacterium]|nr:T9SS type A sorting domain-containing protein [Ignavibacteriota bacterium]MCB9244328.1 T9SS type A sorting domain-containing protein [Ignavibacteriales bacterium]